MEELLWLVSFADDDDRELTTYEVAHALGAGLIDLDTLVWRDGMSEWHPLADVAELASVVERHRAMGLALKKRQTVLGGFRASPTEPLQPLHPLPPLPAPPGATTNALPADPELTGPSNGNAHRLDSSPEAEPPTLRPSAPSFEGLLEDKTPADGTPPVSSDLRRSLGGFKPVPVRRGFSGGGSLTGDDAEDLEGTPSAPESAEPPTDEDVQAASVDSEGFLTIPSAELHTQPRTEFDDEQASDEGASFARLGARELSFSPAEPSAPSNDSFEEDALLTGALQAPRVPVFGKDRAEAATEQPVEVLPRRPRPKPPLLLDNRDGPARTIPPGVGVTTGHVDTDGTAVMSPVQPTLPPPRLSPKKRWFLSGMAAIALGAVSFLAVRFLEQDETAASQAPGIHAKVPTRTFAVQPIAPSAIKPSELAQAPAADKRPDSKLAAATAGNRTAKAANSGTPNREKSSPAKESTEAEAEATSAELAPAVAAVASAVDPAPDLSVAAGPGSFDRDAATNALEQAATDAGSCRQVGDPSGVARVSVTFSDSGKATLATVDGPPFAGTPTGGCIADIMRKARVPAFAGERITVKKTVVIQ